MSDADADADAAPPSPAMQPPSNASLPPPSSPPADTPTRGAAKTPNLPDAPASADPETPFSDAVAPADALASSDAAADALGDAEDDGINPSGARKHITLAPPAPPSKKSKKKNSNSVWTRPASRKGKKKAKQPAQPPTGANGSRPKPSCGEDEFFLTPAPRLAAERNDDAPGLPVLLSRVFKSERIELSEDRLTAGSTKGFRMIRATRGVATGAWYFEVKVLHLGPSGHTRLGWATNSADLQTPVGCDGFGFGYRDVDGSKVHKAWREKYADEGYGEGDVLGFYISLPDGEQYEPKQPDLVHYKGMPFHVEVLKDEQKMPDPVPGSEICYFKNGVCQGTAFVDIPGGRYYPAASMYTLPDEPNCEVKFNFGPDFVFFPEDLGGRPAPRPMSEVPYQAYELKNEGPAENGIAEKAEIMHPEIIEDYDGDISANNDPEITKDYDSDTSIHNDSEIIEDYDSDTPIHNEENEGEGSCACEETSQVVQLCKCPFGLYCLSLASIIFCCHTIIITYILV